MGISWAYLKHCRHKLTLKVKRCSRDSDDMAQADEGMFCPHDMAPVTWGHFLWDIIEIHEGLIGRI